MAERELAIVIRAKDLASKAIKGVNQQLGSIGSHAQRGLKNAANNIGRGIQIAGAAAVGGLAYSVKTAASFEQAFTGVEKTVEATEAQFRELEETIRSMARTGLGTFEDLAAIGEAGGALGIARESLDEFIDVVARLGVSTDLSTEAAATALGQLANVLHLGEDDLEDFADTLVALGNAGASTESQIVEMAARFGAAGNSAGLSKEEILALSSAVASMGIEVEAGGSSLSRIFGNVATAIGTGSKKVDAFTDLLGVSADEFKKRWSKDALGTFQDFLVELGKLDQFEQADVLQRAGITGTRDINAVRLMAQNVGFLGDQLTIAKDATGALDKESQKFLDTTEGRWFTLQQNMRDIAATIGEQMLPIVNELIGDFTEWMNLDSTQSQVSQLAKDVAAGIRDAVTWAKSLDWAAIGSAMQTAASAGKALLDAFLSMPGWLQGAIATGWGLNKLTGGALGNIAGSVTGGFAKAIGTALLQKLGLMNIQAGVVNVNGGVAGGPGGVAGGGGKGGLLGNLLKFAGVGLVAEGARQVSPHVSQAGIDLGKEIFPDGPPLAFLAPSNMPWPLGTKDTPDWVRSGPVGWLTGADQGGPTGGRTAGGTFGPKGADAAGADSVLLARFAPKLDKLATNDVLEHLARTNEMGLKGVGTSFQIGLANGLDPLGNTATRILERAEDPKAPAVMAEIQGHIAGLEEIQRTYLAQGDVSLAAKVQANIDTLHGLIGTTDTQNAIIERQRAEAAAADAAMLGSVERVKGEVAAKGAAQLATQSEALAAVRATHGPLSTIAAKNFSPSVFVNTVVNSFLSINEWQRTVQSAQRSYSTNTGGI